MSTQPNKPIKKPSEYKPDYKDTQLLGPVATVFSSGNTGSWRILRPVVDYSLCIKCTNCQKFCPTEVIEIKEEAQQCIEIDWNYCKGCGICANVCVKQCITMEAEGDAGEKGDQICPE